MRTWNLPDKLVEAVDAHHDLKKTKKFKKEAAVIHLSDILIHVRGYGTSLYQKIPPLQEKALKVLKLNLLEIKDIFFTNFLFSERSNFIRSDFIFYSHLN